MMKDQALSVPAAETEVPIRLPEGVPVGLRSIFADSPVIEGEDVAAYEALLNDFAVAVGPKDVFEWMWVKDIVDLVWIGLRYRRILKELFQWQSTAPADGDQQEPDRFGFLLNQKAEATGRRYKAHNRRAPVSVGPPQVDLMTVYDPSEEQDIKPVVRVSGPAYGSAAGTAHRSLREAFTANAAEIERVSRLLQATDLRRDALLREIEQRRSAIAAQLRRKSDAVLDAEYTETSPP